jgi:hypothetical protein
MQDSIFSTNSKQIGLEKHCTMDSELFRGSTGAGAGYAAGGGGASSRLPATVRLQACWPLRTNEFS